MESARGEPDRSRIFLGWWVVAGLFVVNMTTSGFGFYAQAPFIRALVKEQNFSTGLTGLATGLFFMTSGITGYLTSGLIGRIDVRKMMCAGAVIAGLALVLIGNVETVPQMFGANILFGIGFSLCGLVPSTTVVTRWFARKRSVALSISSTGLSVGGILLAPSVAALVNKHGMAQVTPWLGLAWAAVVIPVTILFVKSWPADHGLYADGADAPLAGAAPIGGWSYLEARVTRYFILLTAAYVFVMLAQVGGLAHQTKMVSDRFGDNLGNLVVSVTAGASVIGRLAGGLVVLRFPPKKLTLALMAVQGVALFGLAAASNKQAILGFCVVFGLSVGNLLMLHPLLLADAFGVKEYSKIYGLSQLMMTTGVGLGPAVVGFVRDAWSYRVAFGLAGVSSIVALALYSASGVLGLQPPKVITLEKDPALSRRIYWTTLGGNVMKSSSKCSYLGRCNNFSVTALSYSLLA